MDGGNSGSELSDMNDTICFVAAIPVPINSSTVTVQTQDPWMMFLSQILAVIVGGIIVFLANYALQMHSFSIQNETNQMNRLNDAYIGLLGAISRYDPTSLPDDDLIFHIHKAFIYGSLTIKEKLNELGIKIAEKDIDGSRNLVEVLKLIIATEIGLGEMMNNKKWQSWKDIKKKGWWQFWK
jgi:hypothetical protein